MFDELPETNPSRDSRKPRAIAAATLIQAALVALLILLQMAVPQRFGNFQMISGTSAAPPPPLGQAPNQQVNKPKPAQKVESHPAPAQPEPPKPDETIPEGVATGHPEGTPGRVSDGQVGGTGDAVRVGGNIRQPEIIKLVKPVYPPEAIKARIE